MICVYGSYKINRDWHAELYPISSSSSVLNGDLLQVREYIGTHYSNTQSCTRITGTQKSLYRREESVLISVLHHMVGMKLEIALSAIDCRKDMV